tara:strand:- start:582 stop:1751 length:1170 start_codon:yes stop_codon:yes gene_type:complete
MTYQISFYLQITACITSILILCKGKKKLFSLIPITLLASSYIFKPLIGKGDQHLIEILERSSGGETDIKYAFINFIFTSLDNSKLLFFCFNFFAAIILINLIYYSFPKELINNKVEKLNKKLNSGQLTFIVFNYSILGLSNLFVNHARQFLSSLIIIYCFFQISKAQKKCRNIKLRTVILSILASLFHLSAFIYNLYFFYLYLQNNKSLIFSRIKLLKFKNNRILKFLNIFILFILILIIYFSIKFLYTSLISSVSIFGLGAYIKEYGFSNKTSIGFILPLIYILPLILYNSILPFSNFFKKTPNDKNYKNYLNVLNLYSFLAIAVMFLESSVSFYSIGRVKSLLWPLIFYLIFLIPYDKKTDIYKKFSFLLIFLLSIFTVLKSYANVI